MRYAPVLSLHGVTVTLFLRVSALERQLDRLSRRERDLLLQIVVRVQRGLTGAAQHIALLHARLLRRGVRTVRALHLGQLHDKHALRLHFDADRVPDRDDLGDFCRLRGDCHRKQQEQGERRAFCVIFCIFHLRYYYAARSTKTTL